METWIDKINESLAEAYFDQRNDGENPKSVVGYYQFGDDSELEVELFRNNTVKVYIYHCDENNERECPNIVDYIEANTYNWEELSDAYDEAAVEYDEWQSHGFRDEADFWRWKEG